jgi:glycerol-3-phosphate dehydrogenase (NAD(P)+)
MTESICVLGAGSWGTALAILLARNGNQVSLWGRDSAAVKKMAVSRHNEQYLPDIPFPKSLKLQPDFCEAVSTCRRALVVVPSHAFPKILSQLRVCDSQPKSVIWGTKGLSVGDGRLLSNVAEQILDESDLTGVISGPSFAKEVGLGLPTALTVAAESIQIAEAFASWFRGDSTRIYTSDDMAGVQLGGGIKNVMAIATGINDGLRLGANSRAALITRGLAEIARMGKLMGGRSETFMGLTGVGDLLLTCTDDQSRNRRAGLGLGSGKLLPQVLSDIGQVVEGVGTTREVFHKSLELGIEMPITTEVYRVLFEDKSPQLAVRDLLKRDPIRE